MSPLKEPAWLDRMMGGMVGDEVGEGAGDCGGSCNHWKDFGFNPE